jgi:hypothetical protein
MRLMAARLLVFALIVHAVSMAGAKAQDAVQPDFRNNTVVRVKGYGATAAEARQDAVRAALQQLIVTDRVIKDDQIVRDNIMSTMNGLELRTQTTRQNSSSTTF